jgi:hypothetical protein
MGRGAGSGLAGRGTGIHAALSLRVLILEVLQNLLGLRDKFRIARLLGLLEQLQGLSEPMLPQQFFKFVA